MMIDLNESSILLRYPTARAFGKDEIGRIRDEHKKIMGWDLNSDPISPVVRKFLDYFLTDSDEQRRNAEEWRKNDQDARVMAKYLYSHLPPVDKFMCECIGFKSKLSSCRLRSIKEINSLCNKNIKKGKKIQKEACSYKAEFDYLSCLLPVFLLELKYALNISDLEEWTIIERKIKNVIYYLKDDSLENIPE